MSDHPQTVTGLSAGGRVGAIDLTWDLAPWEPLVDHYAVHADTTPDVRPSPDTLVGKTVYGRFTQQALGAHAETLWYRVVTVDASGRRSAPTDAVRGDSRESLVAEGQPVATVGAFDFSSLELALAPDLGTGQYAERFPAGVDFVVGRSRPEKDWCYLHPGPEDAWGEGQHTFTLRFPLDEAPDGDLGLALWLIDTHSSMPGRATIAVNGTDAADVEFAPGALRGVVEGDASVPGTSLRHSAVETRLSADLFTPGRNSLTLTKTEGSWHAYDAVGLFVPGAPTEDAGTVRPLR